MTLLKMEAIKDLAAEMKSMMIKANMPVYLEVLDLNEPSEIVVNKVMV